MSDNIDEIISQMSGVSQLTIDHWTDEEAVVAERAPERKALFERLGLATFGRQTRSIKWSDTNTWGTAFVGVPTDLGRAVAARLKGPKQDSGTGAK